MIEIDLNPERDGAGSGAISQPIRVRASEPAANPRRRRYWIGLALGFCGVGLLVGHRAVDQHLKQRIADQGAAVDAMVRDSVDVAQRASDIDAWRSAMEEHTERILYITSLDEQRIQWGELVYAVAQHVPPGVRLARIQTVILEAPPGLGLEIRGFAPNLERVLLYLESLSDKEELDGVELLQVEGQVPHLAFFARARHQRAVLTLEGA